ncbi:hypothetical protein KIN20_024477 [Parelaphostrongylus tenuis]|uniref:Uncharacterized protein n=1 Tax=Parelaphostrongylus tenuis TaxID=148309 RepID=A0AAD5MX20_PARTN|nr:hypothetical protein KIN20_024477 [Parelaphostrongylus tenuis]
MWALTIANATVRRTEKPPIQWSDFFTISLEERYGAQRIRRAKSILWAILERDRKNGSVAGALSSHSTINRTTDDAGNATALSFYEDGVEAFCTDLKSSSNKVIIFHSYLWKTKKLVIGEHLKKDAVKSMNDK